MAWLPFAPSNEAAEALYLEAINILFCIFETFFQPSFSGRNGRDSYYDMSCTLLLGSVELQQ